MKLLYFKDNFNGIYQVVEEGYVEIEKFYIIKRIIKKPINKERYKVIASLRGLILNKQNLIDYFNFTIIDDNINVLSILYDE